MGYDNPEKGAHFDPLSHIQDGQCRACGKKVEVDEAGQSIVATDDGNELLFSAHLSEEHGIDGKQ